MSKRYKNIRTSIHFHDYYSRLKNIALSIYEWKGLPHTCNERFLENTLFQDGHAVFIEDETMSFLNLKVTVEGLNVYNEGTKYTAHSTNYSKSYKAEECVYVRNNPLSKSTDFTIALYAERLAGLELAIQVNINAQKTPVLLRCEEKMKKTVETIYAQYEGDKPVIVAGKAMSDKPLEVLKTDAPFVADRLREEKRALWNEALEFLGINTNPSDKKKERLIVNEVDANNEQIDMQSACFLASRQKACELINEKWGLNVSVRKRNLILEDDKIVEMEGDD